MGKQVSSPLCEALTGMLDQYFASLGNARPMRLHRMVLGATEKCLLEYVMRRCGGNQSAAADTLGINRNTLRKKLADYGLLEQKHFLGEN